MQRSPFYRFLGLCRPHAARILLGVALILLATFLTLLKGTFNIRNCLIVRICLSAQYVP